LARHHEVHGRLDRVGQALARRLRHLDRNGRASGQVVERGGQAAVGEDRRMDAAGEVAQLLEGQPRLLPRAAHELGGLRITLLSALLGHAQGESEGDQALLGAVVQVALDAPPFGVRGLDDA
jgi:hypothetical protein